jgi:hypothetical protein
LIRVLSALDDCTMNPKSIDNPWKHWVARREFAVPREFLCSLAWAHIGHFSKLDALAIAGIPSANLWACAICRGWIWPSRWCQRIRCCSRVSWRMIGTDCQSIRFVSGEFGIVTGAGSVCWTFVGSTTGPENSTPRISINGKHISLFVAFSVGDDCKRRKHAVPSKFEVHVYPWHWYWLPTSCGDTIVAGNVGL